MQKNRLTKNWIHNLYLTLASLLFIYCSMTNAHSAPKTVLVLGDSLSAEYGLARGTGWVALLEKRLQEKRMEVQVVNASISGETTSGGLSRLPSLLKKHQPDVVVVELGGNDGLRGLPLSASIQNFSDIILACKENKAKVLLIGMQIPPNYGRTYVDKFVAIYPDLAKKWSVSLVPFFMAGIADKPGLFQPDQIHLIADAHPHVLENIWPYLYPLIR